MKIFISDLHIGSPLFKVENKLIELFNSSKVEEVFILGDLFDIWYKDIYKIVRENVKFIDYLNDSNKIKVILKGNHDPDVDVMRNILNNKVILNKYETELFGKRTFLIHGEEFDSLAYKKGLGFYIHRFFANYGLNLKAAFRNTVLLIKYLKLGDIKNKLIFEAEKELFNKYSKNYDIIIFGHSHIPKLVRLPEADIINCGCMVYNPTYLIADKNTISLKKL